MSKKTVKVANKYKKSVWGGVIGGKGTTIVLGDATQAQLKKILSVDANASKFIDGDVDDDDKVSGSDLIKDVDAVVADDDADSKKKS